VLFSLQLLASLFEVKGYRNDRQDDCREAERHGVELEFAAIAQHRFRAFAALDKHGGEKFRPPALYTPRAPESCRQRILPLLLLA